MIPIPRRGGLLRGTPEGKGMNAAGVIEKFADMVTRMKKIKR